MKHMDKIAVTIDNEVFQGHIEERFLNQWPDDRRGLFVIIDDGNSHFPIPIRHFQPELKEIYNYGAIQLIDNQQTTQ